MQLAFAEADESAGAVTVGLVVSLTVKTTVSVPVLPDVDRFRSQSPCVVRGQPLFPPLDSA